MDPAVAFERIRRELFKVADTVVDVVPADKRDPVMHALNDMLVAAIHALRVED